MSMARLSASRRRSARLWPPLVVTLAIAGCSQELGAPHHKAAAKPSAPRIDASLALPNNDGRVHIIVIPGEVGEQQRCIVATTPAGHVSTSCAPKEIAPAPDQ